MTREPEEIRQEIEATREELADTAAALAYKTDVKARAKERVEEVKTTPPVSTVKDNPVPTGLIVAAVVGLAVAFVVIRRRN